MVPFVLIALCVFFPRAMAQWVVSIVVAFIAAYMTTANQYWIAPIEPFLLWYMADYAIMQLIFWVLNRRHRHA
jgi:hypothetical protein